MIIGWFVELATEDDYGDALTVDTRPDAAGWRREFLARSIRDRHLYVARRGETCAGYGVMKQSFSGSTSSNFCMCSLIIVAKG
jgi:hypothetical protein